MLDSVELSPSNRRSTLRSAAAMTRPTTHAATNTSPETTIQRLSLVFTTLFSFIMSFFHFFYCAHTVISTELRIQISANATPRIRWEAPNRATTAEPKKTTYKSKCQGPCNCHAEFGAPKRAHPPTPT